MGECDFQPLIETLGHSPCGFLSFDIVVSVCDHTSRGRAKGALCLGSLADVLANFVRQAILPDLHLRLAWAWWMIMSEISSAAL